MNVVDSSGWLEYFGNTANASFFAEPIENSAQLLVPSVVLYEVFKRILQQRSEEAGHQAVVQMRLGRIVDLNAELALYAAQLSHAFKLPLADSIILATARTHDATLWTQDADFEQIDGVRYVEKR